MVDMYLMGVQMAALRRPGLHKGHFEHFLWNFCSGCGGKTMKVDVTSEILEKVAATRKGGFSEPMLIWTFSIDLVCRTHL
jgi:hypothetical protein